MIAEKIMWHVICDGCGIDAQEGSEHVAWEPREASRFYSTESEWWTDDADRDLCPDCAP